MVENEDLSFPEKKPNLLQKSNSEVSGLAVFHPQIETSNTSTFLMDYEKFLEVRGKIIKIIRNEDSEEESIVDQIVDALLKHDGGIPKDPISLLLASLGVGKKIHSQRKKKELLSKIVRALLEQIFDPALKFTMKKQDILDTCEAYGLQRDEVKRNEIDKIYSTVLHHLKVGKLRDLAYQERICFYVQEQIEEITLSRLNWKVDT